MKDAYRGMRTGEGTTIRRRESRKSSEQLESLFLRHSDGALRFAYFLTSNRDQAEDIVQEAFIRVSGRFGSISKPERFRAYLNKTILNLARGQARRNKREADTIARLRRQPTAPAHMGDASQTDLVWKSLLKLPQRQRAAIFFRFYEDLTESEVAQILGCSTGSVKSLVYRAMNSLRGILEDGGTNGQ